MTTIAHLIDAIGADVLAKRLETTSNHIRTIRSRNSLPAKFWKEVAAAAREAAPQVLEESKRLAKLAKFLEKVDVNAIAGMDSNNLPKQ